ncbi:hypothetical protein EI94DRAFT_1729142 [Lactarius quietus]|nr:hypothetical protein EI94DRAFT_1729142 [Lactarius quietus]
MRPQLRSSKFLASRLEQYNDRIALGPVARTRQSRTWDRSELLNSPQLRSQYQGGATPLTVPKDSELKVEQLTISVASVSLRTPTPSRSRFSKCTVALKSDFPRRSLSRQLSETCVLRVPGPLISIGTDRPELGPERTQARSPHRHRHPRSGVSGSVAHGIPDRLP